MPTDLQLIDGLEALRELYERANPPSDRRSPLAGDFTQLFKHEPPAVQLIMAWYCLIPSPYQPGRINSEEARICRNFAHGVLQSSDTEGNIPLLQVGLGRLAEQGLWPLRGGERPPAAAWAEQVRRLLPKVNPLGALRLAQRLGFDLAVPEALLRRLLWRLGTLTVTRGAAAIAAATSELERIARLSGLGGRQLQAMLAWLCSGHGQGGSLCSTRPRCHLCPLRAACAYGRLTPGGVDVQAGETGGDDPLEDVRRQVCAARQGKLAELELLALLAPGGAALGGTFAVAENLLRRFGGLPGLERASIGELVEVRGVSRARAVQIKAALELGRRFGAEAAAPREAITGSADVWRAYRNRFRHLPQEHFVIVLLDTKNRVLHDHIVSKGSLTGSLAHPREVFQQAVRQSANAVILLHNHPSGDPTPSPDDRAVTRRLSEAGEVLGIKVLDHIVLGADRYYSFSDEGLL